MLKSAEKVPYSNNKSPDKQKEDGMNSNESFNENNVGGGASSKFFTGFKGLFKRVIGVTTNEMAQKSEEKKMSKEIINEETVQTPSFNFEEAHIIS